jgi:quercetin dioxygenase-like cupin family protein
MSDHPALRHLAAGEGKSLPLGKIGLSFKAGSIVGSRYAVAEITLPAGSANPLHRHPGEETMYVLEGEFEMVGEGDDRRVVGPGCVMHVPAGATHGFINVGKTTGRLLMISPVEQEPYFDDLSAAMAAAKADPDAVAKVRARHGVESVGPVAKVR